MTTVSANGVAFHVAVEGNPRGPWVTFSNSHATDLTHWDRQAALLAPRFRVLRYDARGHGRSAASPAPYDFSLLARDVVALWDALGIESSHFVGLSLGGSTGLTLAIEHPARVASLLAADCRAWAPPAFRAAWEPRIEAARAKGMEALVASTVERWFTASFVAANPPVLERIRDMIRRTSVEGYIGCAQALQTIDCRARLGEIACPVRLLAGAHDPAATPESIAEIEARIPGARFAVIPDAAHMPNIENPAPFDAALTAFLDEVAREPGSA